MTKDYDLDPEAIEWARAKVQWAVDRARNFESKSTDNAEGWRRVANIIEMWLLGDGTGCVITPLDPRLPELKPIIRGGDGS